MSETRHNFLVGLFVLCGLLALGALIVLFGRGPTWLMGGERYTLNIYFDYASGIREGTQVTVSGKEIGRVVDVGFRDRNDLTLGVQVVVTIESEYKLPRGSRAETFEAGLLAGGRPPISIIIPSAPGPGFLQNGDSLQGVILGAVNAIFPEDVVNVLSKSATQIGSAAEALTPVLGDLHEVLQPRGITEVDRPGGPPGNLSTAMARFDLMLRDLNEVVGDPEVRANVKDSVANIRTMTEDGTGLVTEWKDAAADVRNMVADAKTLLSDAQATLQKTDGHVDRVARKMTDDLEQMGRVLDELYTLTRGINQGQGTIGQLVVDAKLYDAMVLSFRRLAETVEEFRLLVKDWQKGKVRVAF